MMTTILLAFIGTYFIELLYYRITLSKQLKEGIKKFDSNKGLLMKINLSGYKLGSGHIYE